MRLFSSSLHHAVRACLRTPRGCDVGAHSEIDRRLGCDGRAEPSSLGVASLESRGAARYTPDASISARQNVSLRSLPYFAAALLWLGTPVSGSAQARKGNAQPESEGYRETIGRALQELQLGNFAEAREQFARAHALFPNARTLRGLGITEFELRHYLVAAEHLGQALESNVKPLEGKLRQETKDLLERAQAYIGELRLALSPRDALVVIDGTQTVASTGGPIRIEVGDHVLEFRASDCVTERRQVTVHGGQPQVLRVELAPLAPAATEPPAQAALALPAAPTQEEARSERVPVYKRWWPWTILGVVVAGAVAGTVVGLRARETSTEYRGVSSENTPMGAGLQPLWVK
jgi:hypothetical protein